MNELDEPSLRRHKKAREMPNDQIPIEDADLWDILDWDLTAKLSEGAVGIPHDNPIAWSAKRLIDGAADGKDLEFFHTMCTRFIGSGRDGDRRVKASELAMLFGADPVRLIDFLAFKWGVFKRTSRVAK
jgi:hypothetical protein